MHGKGKMEWPDGHNYEGHFEEGVFHGLGKFFYKNGDIYEGEWENDARHGEGKFYNSKTGQRRVCMWDNDVE